ncbi:hypothetical protein F4775DRAFT_536853 [Biscogniauxia sp. FL1348]|nr:hypothetical protein F4775DRAFT_536853 [Biscogniauxia sp. FL1348]
MEQNEKCIIGITGTIAVFYVLMILILMMSGGMDIACRQGITTYLPMFLFFALRLLHRYPVFPFSFVDCRLAALGPRENIQLRKSHGC